jgi:cytoskeletal protein CcmA (bactofilin family)
MFRKKDETGKPADPSRRDGDMAEISAQPLKPFSRKGSHAPAKPPSSSSFHPEVPRRAAPDIPGVPPRRPGTGITSEADSKRLVIARDICLAGEITSCDKLVVEGRVEVALPGARIIEVAPTGFFKGSADVEEADISGRFDGELIVRDRLVVRNGGRISGTIRYGRIVIESGGEISGDMQTLDANDKAGDGAPAKGGK